ncbi:hypothetical protein PYW07_001194 [Mythimna separata]|uniref:Jumonji domain-containing protein 4 n=1 Tax=Mythimna separata TaxID=271217 RepID=A0AAD7YSZ3_MYTSE|nr:hypothetical protein PYW07_001194 [Mythimna separata]
MMQSKIEIQCPLDTEIPEYDYSNWNINDANFQQCNFDFTDFFNNFMLKNLPCQIKNVTDNWKCARQWVKGDQINYDNLIEEYGDLIAPVADCKNIQFNSQCKSDMKVHQYIEYLQNATDNRLLYLKDWHLRRSRPDDKFYEVPPYFILDWLNEYAMDNKEDDFMFVYIGPKGSWTPLHEDVYCSYSWSVNVVGRKKWILFPPGEEDKLKDRFDNLPLVFEPEKFQNIKYFEITQEAGDALFVPSGWHHQVINEAQTISVNHNWINACNVEIVWKALEKCLIIVEHQIEECKGTPEFPAECQLILKSHFGMDFESFVTFLCYIAKKRLSQLQGNTQADFNQYTLGKSIIKFDLKNILKVLNSIYVHPIFLNTDILSSKEDEFIQVRKDLRAVFSFCK